jgi:hypothetical protein
MAATQTASWRCRQDVFLSSGARLVLLRDLDGELVVRLLTSHGPERPWTYVTPKLRVERDFFEALLLAHEHAVRLGALTINLTADTAEVMIEDRLAGWAPRRRFGNDLRAFLRLCEETPGPPLASKGQERA